MMTLTYDTPGLVESETHKFGVDASDLGLKPCEWPGKIETTLGNGLPFVRQSRVTLADDLWAMHYVQVAGCLDLLVFND